MPREVAEVRPDLIEELDDWRWILQARALEQRGKDDCNKMNHDDGLHMRKGSRGG